jgi:hypothetical protein
MTLALGWGGTTLALAASTLALVVDKITWVV